jgi:transporter family protein
MTEWKIYAVGSAVFAGLTAVLAKIGVQNIPSNLATLIRTVVIVVFLGFLIWGRHEWRNPLLLDRRCLIFLVLSALTTGFSWLCYYRALQTGPASLVAPIDKLSLVFAVLLAVVFLGERLSLQQSVGIALMVGGTFCMIL